MGLFRNNKKTSDPIDASVNFTTRGEPGLNRQGGTVTEEWTNDINNLTDRYKAYQEMRDNHPVVGGGVLVWSLLIQGSKTTIEPTGGTAEHHRQAEFIQGCIDDIAGGFDGWLADFATSTLTHGFSLYEPTFKIRRGMGNPIKSQRSRYSDNKQGWRAFSPRGQDTLTPGEEWVFVGDDVVGVNQSPMPDMIQRFIPYSSLLHFKVGGEKNNPEGRSLLRSAYVSYITQRELIWTENVGITRNLAGMPVFEVPKEVLAVNASSDNKAMRSYFENIIRAIHVNEQTGLLMPASEDRDGKTGFGFRLASSGGKSNTDTDAIVRRYDSRIAMAMITEGMLLGADQTASLALSQDKRGMLANGVDAVLKVRDGVFNTSAIPDLIQRNGWDVAFCPRMTHGKVDAATMQEVAAYVSTLVGANVMSVDNKLESHLREAGDLPQRDSGGAVEKRQRVDISKIITEALGDA